MNQANLSPRRVQDRNISRSRSKNGLHVNQQPKTSWNRTPGFQTCSWPLHLPVRWNFVCTVKTVVSITVTNLNVNTWSSMAIKKSCRTPRSKHTRHQLCQVGCQRHVLTAWSVEKQKQQLEPIDDSNALGSTHPGCPKRLSLLYA